jgi:uncharacterized caspase-like protein
MRHPALCNLVCFAALLFSCIPVSSAVASESRVALVIGQSAYRAVPALPNASNDAKRMSDLLGSAGFDVTAAPDLSQGDMRQAISNFANKVTSSGPDTVALVFYAGHGLQIDGENYLVPVDVDPRREADIPLQAVRLNDLMNTLGALPTRMRIFMLDACRNNPFPALAGATPHGLAIVDTKAGASGSFISYSTSPGAEAEDGDGADSPYTTAVLQVAREPNLPIEEAFKRIRVAVNRATDGRQTPWESSSLTSEFKFFGAEGGQPPETTPKTSTPSTPAGARPTADDWKRTLQGKDARVAYEMVVADDTVAAYEAYVGLFAQAQLAPRVRSLLERRREMMAWANAVAVNTGAAFASFLASYGSSDLAATARKLEERVRNRTLATAALAALGPNCPAPTLPAIQPLKKNTNNKNTDQQPTKKADKPAKAKPTKEVVESTPKQDQGIPPAAVLEGVGIGVGIGLGMGGGMGGRGGGMGGGGMSPGGRMHPGN